MDDEKIVYLLTRYSTLRMRINQPCPRERPNSIQHRKTVSHTQDRASGSQKKPRFAALRHPWACPIPLSKALSPSFSPWWRTPPYAAVASCLHGDIRKSRNSPIVHT